MNESTRRSVIALHEAIGQVNVIENTAVRELRDRRLGTEALRDATCQLRKMLMESAKLIKAADQEAYYQWIRGLLPETQNLNNK